MRQYECIHLSRYYESELVSSINQTLDAGYVPISISVTKTSGSAYSDAFLIVRKPEQQIIDN